MEANLIITFDPNHAGLAKEEAKKIISEIGQEAEFEEIEVPGVFEVKVDDPKELVKKARELCQENPDMFEKTFKWIPIEKWCSSDVSDMQETIVSLIERIDKDDKWKLDLGKRKYDMPTNELIIKLTDPIDRPHVDLKNPDKIVEVQIIGNKAGISILNADEFLDVQKIKR